MRPKLLTPKQAAFELGVTEQTLANWRNTKLQGPRWIRIGRMVRYEWSEIEAFITRNLAI